METVELAAEIRETRPKSRVRGLRREGRIPAVLYGPKTKATAIAISGVIREEPTFLAVIFSS